MRIKLDARTRRSKLLSMSPPCLAATAETWICRERRGSVTAAVPSRGARFAAAARERALAAFGSDVMLDRMEKVFRDACSKR